jgi:hypothetical protein
MRFGVLAVASSGMVWYMITSVSEEYTASIFRNTALKIGAMFC